MFASEMLMAVVVMLVCLSWYPCSTCCGSEPPIPDPPDDCNGCQADTTAAQYSVVIPALTEHTGNNPCADCSGYNGTYVLTYEETIATICYYRSRIADPGSCDSGGLIDLELIIYGNAVSFRIVEVTDGRTLWIWETQHASAIDCDFSSYELEDNCSIYSCICDGTGTSVYVTAV